MRRLLIAGLVVLIAFSGYLLIAVTVAVIRYLDLGDRYWCARAGPGVFWCGMAVLCALSLGSLLLAMRIRRRLTRNFAKPSY
jgi:hypothetical protein